MQHSCEHCKLRFETSEDLARHQKKFCINSEYGNVHRLEKRMEDLKTKRSQNGSAIISGNPGLNDIKAYLRGPDLDPTTKPLNPLQFDRSLEDYKTYQAPTTTTHQTFSKPQATFDNLDLFAQLKGVKETKNIQRQLNNDTDQEMYQLLQDLEQRKEKELRAQIEKEEIMRNIKDMDQRQLSAMERERKRELEKLAAEREALRVREQQMLDEVKRMEFQLLDQEKHFRNLRDSVATTAQTKPLANFFNSQEKDWDYHGKSSQVEGEIRRKELELAKDRGVKVTEIKVQRDRLEKERLRIMDDLEKIRSGEGLPHRRNEAARFVAEQSLNLGGNLEPSLKDKLTADQNRLNQLRQRQQDTYNQLLPDMDDLDVLQKELEGRSYQQEASQFVNQFNEQRGNNPAHLSAIRNKLEQNQAAAPSSSFFGQQQRQNYNHPQQQVNLENLLMNETEKNPLNYTDTEQQRPNETGIVTNLHALKDDYLLNGGEDPEFLSKLGELEQFIKYRKPLGNNRDQQQAPRGVPVFQQPPQTLIPQPQPQPQSNPYGMMMPPFSMFPPPPQQMMIPSQPPTSDPAMEQMTQLMKMQEMETQKLKQALESLNVSNSANHYDKIIEKTTKELEELQNRLMQGDQQEGISTDDVFEEDFMFRQNEMRSEDLEVEERALMNLAAQEYDALRILSKLPKDSEIYLYKMQQYREMSTMRAEMEKMLQEQRIEKIRREFEKQKVEEERRYKHESWIEEQKRRILEAKVKGAQMQFQQSLDAAGVTQQNQQYNNNENVMNQMRQSQYGGEQQANNQVSPRQPDTSNAVGFILGVDYIFNLPKEFRQLRVVYSLCLNKRFLIDPRMIDLRGAEADMNNPSCNKVFFNIQQVLRNVQPHQQANLIIELQTPSQTSPQGFASVGWTIINAFDSNLNLNKGIWKLPIYKPPTLLDLDLKDLQKLTPFYNTQACIRICMPNDEVFVTRPTVQTTPAQYEIPPAHSGVGVFQQPPSLQPPGTVNKQPTINNQLQNDPKVPQVQNAGVEIKLHFIRGIRPFTRVKIQATLYEGTQIIKLDVPSSTQAGIPTTANSNSLDCNWASSGIDSTGQQLLPKGSKVDILPNGQLQITKPLQQGPALGPDDIIVNINQEVTWLKDLSSLIKSHGMKDNAYLLLQAFLIAPKINTAGPISSSQYENIGYTVFQLNNPDSSLRFGTFELGLYRPPINLIKQEITQALQTFIKFSINQPNPQLSQQNNNVIENQRPVSEQFIPNFDKQWTKSEDFLAGEGIDVYIDWARYLPDNTTFSRVFVRVIDIDGGYPIQGQRGLASVDFSTARSPFFGFKYEIRAPRLSPTLLLVVSFETIDKSTNQPCYCGHSYFPLFMDKVSEMPVTDRNVQQFSLHKGFYQMPIYSEMPNLLAPVTYEKFFSLERIPTASMLVRVQKAPKGPDGTALGLDNVPQVKWEESKVLIHAPTYADGIYSTQYYFNTPLELQMFKLRKMRKETQLSVVIDRLITLAKQPITKTPDEKLDILNQLISLPPNSTKMIDMNYFAPYNPDLGFRFEVEAVYNNTLPNSIFMVLASLCPSATLYDQGRVQPPTDCVCFNEIDWQSNVHTQKFIDGLFMMQNIQARAGMSIIFDIKRLIPGQTQYENYGFAVVPIFSTQQNEEEKQLDYFINSGIHQLPIFLGPMTPDLLSKLKTTQDTLLTIATEASKFKFSDSTLIIEVVDNQRERHFEKGFESHAPTLKFMPQMLVAKCGYKQPTQAEKDAHKKLSALIPAGQQPTQYQQFLTDAINNQFKLA